MREIFAKSGSAFLVGITGAPGAGKSTLVDGLVSRWRKASKTVGVIAVDPTSPFSGGAMLGDRVRMQAHAQDAGVFIRSMATRGHLGGLARATADAALVLDAAGKHVVTIETVGVGQDEVEIARTADVTIVVLVPGMGDDVQVMKAGVMEIADIFLVNKSDREGADRTVAEIESLLSLHAYGRRRVASADCRHPGDDWARSRRTGRHHRAFPRAIGADGVAASHACACGSASLHSGRPSDEAGRCPGHGRGDGTVWSIASRSRRSTRTARRAKLLRREGSVTAESMKAILDHVGIAVRDLEASLAFFRDGLGLEVEPPEEVPSQRVRAQFLATGPSSLELLQATSPDSPIAKFLEKRGPGLHHITLRVDDIQAALQHLRQRRVTPH